MAQVLENLSEDECYLLAILDDASGLDLAEFTWVDNDADDGCFRCWPFQWAWFRNEAGQQIDQCFAEGTLILTERGQVPIEEVGIGDRVLTHLGRWKKVTYRWDRGEQETVIIKGHGHPGLTVTPDHKFLTQGGGWEAPEVGALWGSSSMFPAATVPDLPVRTYAPGRPSNIPNDIASPEFMWLYGLYLAEGSCSSSFGRGGTINRTTFSVHTDEIQRVEKALCDVGLRFNTQPVKGEACSNIVVNSGPLATWFKEHGGTGARNKRLATWALGLERELRRAVLDGAMFGDGYTARNEYCTSSKCLALGIKMLAQTVGFSTTFRYAGPRTSEIQDRTVNSSGLYTVGLDRTGRAARLVDGHWWSRIKDRTPGPTARCFDLEVEDDHSFVAEGIAVSNCARAIGKSMSIMMRAFVFPFAYPDREMVVTAPEGVHVDAITDLIETKFYSVRLGREMLIGGRYGVKHKPFHMNFANNARIMGRIPQITGKGVKGIHPIWLELDEAQDYPPAGWTELIETLNRNTGKKGTWRAHGVTRGVRDRFHDLTDSTDPENRWMVHRYCLPGDTLVYGVDRPVPIRDIRVGTEIHTITHEGVLSNDRVTAVIDNGIQPTWEMRARDGFSLISTFNHPYLVLGRSGTRKTRRDLSFEWVEAQNLRPGDVIIATRELPSTGASVSSVEEIYSTLDAKSPSRVVPEWVWRATPQMQLAFLHGYLLGDGSLSRQPKGQCAWQIGTASKVLAKGLRALCHYLGLRATRIESNDCGPLGLGPQYRFCIYGDRSWFQQVPTSYSIHPLPLGKNFVARTVTFSAPTGESEPTYDITVGMDHNFIAEGVVVHNTAMHRPTWTDEERQEKIAMYNNSKDDPDYRRNVLGMHGDATNPIFVLHRLMQCVDDDLGSDYNVDEYYKVALSDRQVAENDILSFLYFPYRHINDYTVKGKRARYWCGMDIGFTRDPSEILVFVEHSPTERWDKEKQKWVSIPKERRTSVLKLLTRITLRRIRIHDQAAVIKAVMEFYRPECFAMDKAGNGIGLYQMVMDDPSISQRIKGYNHTAKEIVEIDEATERDPKTGEIVKEALMKRNMLEYSTDKLRELVDSRRWHMPWDKNLVGQFEGATETARQRGQDAYGRSRTFSSGEDHALDACRQAAMAFTQETIDELLKEERFEPIIDRFVTTF